MFPSFSIRYFGHAAISPHLTALCNRGGTHVPVSGLSFQGSARWHVEMKGSANDRFGLASSPQPSTKLIF
jgi:hypothetical protein